VTDSARVPYGKGDKYPGGGVKEFLKPCACKPSELSRAYSVCGGGDGVPFEE